jgi:hypothetical protein
MMIAPPRRAPGAARLLAAAALAAAVRPAAASTCTSCSAYRGCYEYECSGFPLWGVWLAIVGVSILATGLCYWSAKRKRARLLAQQPPPQQPYANYTPGADYAPGGFDGVQATGYPAPQGAYAGYPPPGYPPQYAAAAAPGCADEPAPQPPGHWVGAPPPAQHWVGAAPGAAGAPARPPAAASNRPPPEYPTV